jgi:hypothetical protein
MDIRKLSVWIAPLITVILCFFPSMSLGVPHEHILDPNRYLLVINNASTQINNRTIFSDFIESLKDNTIIVHTYPIFGSLLIDLTNKTIPEIKDIFRSGIDTHDINDTSNSTLVCEILKSNPNIKSCEPSLMLPPP